MKTLRSLTPKLLLITLGFTGLNADCFLPCGGFDGWYFGATGAVGQHNDHSFINKSVTPTTKETRSYNTGFGAGLSIGHFLADGWRIEAEWVYRRQSLNCANLPGIGSGEACGHNVDNAFMANVFYDYYICHEGFSIFAGAGLGFSLNEIGITSVNGVQPNDDQKYSRDEVFAWQVLAGASCDVSPQVDLTLGYRLFTTHRIHSPVGGHSSHAYPMTHSLDLGIRIKL